MTASIDDMLIALEDIPLHPVPKVNAAKRLDRMIGEGSALVHADGRFRILKADRSMRFIHQVEDDDRVIRLKAMRKMRFPNG